MIKSIPAEKNYKDMIRLYYDDFEKPLEKAKEEMQGVKIKLKEEETDEICRKVRQKYGCQSRQIR